MALKISTENNKIVFEDTVNGVKFPYNQNYIEPIYLPEFGGDSPGVLDKFVAFNHRVLGFDIDPMKSRDEGLFFEFTDLLDDLDGTFANMDAVKTYLSDKTGFDSAGGAALTTLVLPGGIAGETLIWNGTNWIPNPDLTFDPIIGITGQTFTAGLSLRLVNPAYVGNCIRLRRSSDDTTLDIGFDVFGNLDTSAALSFVGVDNGFVDTWFDQYGSFDVSQATLANQPQIITAGVVITDGGKPAIDFDGTMFLNGVNPVPGAANGLSGYIVVNFESANVDESAFTCGGNGASNGFFLRRLGAATTLQLSMAVNTSVFTSQAELTRSQYSMVRLGNTPSLYREGVFQNNISGAGTVVASPGDFYVGSLVGGIDNFVGKMQELLIHTSFTDPDRLIIESNQIDYWLLGIANTLNLNSSLEVEGTTILTRVSLRPFIAIVDSIGGILIPVHLGTEATELVIPFENKAIALDPVFDFNAGILTLLRDIKGFTSTLELHITKSGGGLSVLATWGELSTDGGATFSLIPDSLRTTDISMTGEGIVAFHISLESPLPTGIKFRIKLTNIGATDISLVNPSDVNTFLGTISGQGARAAFL